MSGERQPAPLSCPVSVIVCTFNRAETLADTLRDLKEQAGRLAPTPELVLVDNNSRDSTPEVVRALNAEGGPEVRYVLERKQGLSAARNAGIRAAAGELLLFTDDDVRLDPDWIGELAGAFREPEVHAAAGVIEPLWPDAVPAWVGPREAPFFPGVVGRFHLGDTPRWLAPDDPHPLGANMAFRRHVFAEVGGFREDLGRTGGNLAGGEDMELYERVLARYGRVRYVPSARVHHRVSERMLHRRYFLRCLYGGGYSLADYERWQEHPRLMGVPRYLLRRLAGQAAGCLGASLRLDIADAFQHLGWLAHGLGLCAGIRAHAARGSGGASAPARGAAR